MVPDLGTALPWIFVSLCCFLVFLPIFGAAVPALCIWVSARLLVLTGDCTWLLWLPFAAICRTRHRPSARTGCRFWRSGQPTQIRMAGNGYKNMESNGCDMRRLLERNQVSDEELRKHLKDYYAKLLRWGYKPTAEEQLSTLVSFAEALKRMPLIVEAEPTFSFFYKLSDTVLGLVLGSNFKYGVCYFNDEATKLDDAEIAMYELYCERAQLKDGQTILDVGCGWGGFSFYLAKKYPNSQISGLTSSVTQKDIIEAKCKKLKISNIDIILEDAAQFETTIGFDRVVIIEVIEYFRNYQQLFKKFSTWIKDDGLIFIEYVCHKAFACSFEAMDEDDWLSTYGFDLTLFPALNLPLYFQDDISVVDHWIVNGNHFARSNIEWLKKMDENLSEIKSHLESEGESEEEIVKITAMMRFSFILLDEMFSYNNGEEWVASHILFKKK